MFFSHCYSNFFKLEKVAKFVVLAICMAFFINELVKVGKKTIQRETFVAANDLALDKLLLPSITICPAPAWKKMGPFLTPHEMEESAFYAEEMFHPESLKAMKDETIFQFSPTNTIYYGRCHTIKNIDAGLAPDPFKIMLNNSIDYIFYLHEPSEEKLLITAARREVDNQPIEATSVLWKGADFAVTKELHKKLSGNFLVPPSLTLQDLF